MRQHIIAFGQRDTKQTVARNEIKLETGDLARKFQNIDKLVLSLNKTSTNPSFMAVF